MRKMVFVILSLLLMVLANESQAKACFCVAPPLDKSFEAAASVFIGEVVQISGPSDVETGSGVEQFYVVKFFVWEQWKGTKGFEVELLSPKQRSCFGGPELEIGKKYLIFADPVTVKDGSTKIQGILKPCTLTSLFVGSGPQPTVRLDALATIFALDKLTNPPPQRMPAFGRKEIGKGLCLFC